MTERFRTGMRGVLQLMADSHRGAHWLSISEQARIDVRQSLVNDWRRIKELKLHPAGMVTLDSWFVRADRALKLDETTEFLRLLQMIEDKVNQELEWRS